MPALLTRCATRSATTLAAARAELKEHLLGPSDPPSLARFDAAIADLCAKADERRVRMTARLGAEIPAQRAAAEESAHESEQGLGADAGSEDSGAEDSVTA